VCGTKKYTKDLCEVHTSSVFYFVWQSHNSCVDFTQSRRELSCLEFCEFPTIFFECIKNVQVPKNLKFATACSQSSTPDNHTSEIHFLFYIFSFHVNIFTFNNFYCCFKFSFNRDILSLEFLWNCSFFPKSTWTFNCVFLSHGK
jgi:hypothetical protein